MAFLELADYYDQVTTQVLTEVTGGDDSLRTKAEAAAIDEMSSYLSARYDTVQIFNKTGNARNKLIAMYMVDIVLYHLHSRIAPHSVPELRTTRYKDAIKWHTDVAKEVINPVDLPLPEDEEGEQVFPNRFGSAERLTSEW